MICGYLRRLGGSEAGPCFLSTPRRVPCPSRVLCERAGLLVDVTAADHLIHAKGFVTTRCPTRSNLDHNFLAACPHGFSWRTRKREHSLQLRCGALRRL